MTKNISCLYTFHGHHNGHPVLWYHNKGKNEQERRLSTIAKLSEPDSSSVITPLPLPRAFHTDQVTGRVAGET